MVVLVEVHQHPAAHQRLEAWPTKGALLGASFQVGELGGNQEVACLQKANSKMFAALDDWVFTPFMVGKCLITKSY